MSVIEPITPKKVTVSTSKDPFQHYYFRMAVPSKSSSDMPPARPLRSSAFPNADMSTAFKDAKRNLRYKDSNGKDFIFEVEFDGKKKKIIMGFNPSEKTTIEQLRQFGLEGKDLKEILDTFIPAKEMLPEHFVQGAYEYCTGEKLNLQKPDDKALFEDLLKVADLAKIDDLNKFPALKKMYENNPMAFRIMTEFHQGVLPEISYTFTNSFRILGEKWTADRIYPILGGLGETQNKHNLYLTKDAAGKINLDADFTMKKIPFINPLNNEMMYIIATKNDGLKVVKDAEKAAEDVMKMRVNIAAVQNSDGTLADDNQQMMLFDVLKEGGIKIASTENLIQFTHSDWDKALTSMKEILEFQNISIGNKEKLEQIQAPERNLKICISLMSDFLSAVCKPEVKTKFETLYCKKRSDFPENFLEWISGEAKRKEDMSNAFTIINNPRSLFDEKIQAITVLNEAIHREKTWIAKKLEERKWIDLRSPVQINEKNEKIKSGGAGPGEAAAENGNSKMAKRLTEVNRVIATVSMASSDSPHSPLIHSPPFNQPNQTKLNLGEVEVNKAIVSDKPKETLKKTPKL
jgi:hypothetical protein